MALLWSQFIICSAIIVVCGANLSRYGDVIAEKVGLGRAWIGLILMASVTSLPELITGVSSVAFVGAPNIAMGDILGSCVFNLAIIALMDMLHGSRPIFARAEQGHILSAAFGVIMIGFVSASLLVEAHIPSIGHIGLYTPLLALIYGIGVRGVFLFEKKKVAAHIGELAEKALYGHIPVKQAVFRYAVNAAIVIGAAAWLPFLGNRIAAATGLGGSFVGTVFIALVTSLPELVVSIASLRIGATDMAIANLLGSNMFNIFILAVDDVAFTRGPILSHVAQSHAVTGFTAMIMTGIVIAGLTYRLEKKTFLRLGWDAAALLAAYGLILYFLFAQRGAG